MDTNKILAGALAGFVAALAVDIRAFQAWRSVQQFAEFDWKTAAFRWVMGAVLGAVSALGLSSAV